MKSKSLSFEGLKDSFEAPKITQKYYFICLFLVRYKLILLHFSDKL